METAHSMVVMFMFSFSRTAHTLQDELTSVVKAMTMTMFVCLLLNGTSALFRPLVPRIVEIEHTNRVKMYYQ